MNRVSRAKQFLPFDALKGFEQALREKEIEYEDKKELSEDTLQELNNKFNQVENGKYVELKYYKNGRYSKIKGIVTNKKKKKKKIQINKIENISIYDIISILV